MAQIHLSENVSAPAFCKGEGLASRHRLSVVDSLRGFALLTVCAVLR